MDKLFELLQDTQEIERRAYKVGFDAGYNSRQKEMEDKRAKEMDEMYQDSLVPDGSAEYPLGGMIEPVDIEREK